MGGRTKEPHDAGGTSGLRMTLEEIRAHDLLRTSIHEAAHVVVAQHFGVPAQAYVVLIPDEPNLLERKTSVGRTFHGNVTKSERKMIGLAGEVAVLLLGDPDLVPSAVVEHLEFETSVSESDRDAIGEFDEEDIVRCIEVLRDGWHEIETIAAELRERAEGPES